MIDQSRINLLTLINPSNLKRVASTNGGEYHSACPFCGGRDRFIIQPNAHRWFCRQCHTKWGDAIEFVACRDNLNLKDGNDFTKALSSLDLESVDNLAVQKQQSTPSIASLELNPKPWLEPADYFVAYCETALSSDSGVKAYNYLCKRGISPDVIKQAQLGFNAKPYQQKWHEISVYIPRAIIFPWKVDDFISGIRYRTATHQFKWAKGSTGKGLYNSNAVCPDKYVVLVESEICCLVIQSQARQQTVVPVATGGVSGSRLLRWIVRLSLAKHVFVAFDNDEAGHVASEWWLRNLKNSSRLLPTQKDPGDMYLAQESITNWIQHAVQSTEDMSNV